MDTYKDRFSEPQGLPPTRDRDHPIPLLPGALPVSVLPYRYYNAGEFLICTYQRSLIHLGDQRAATPMQQKAFFRLMGLQYLIIYKQGKANVAADALSRRDNSEQFHSVTSVQTRRLEIISAAQAAIGGHSGVEATYKRVRDLFSWPGMKNDIQKFIQSCEICRQAKGEHVRYPGLLQPRPIPPEAWHTSSMDLIEKLPLSQGFDKILVVVDKFSKYAHFVALHHPFTALSVAQAFIINVCKLHGMPQAIISDRDKVFTGRLWQTPTTVVSIDLSALLITDDMVVPEQLLAERLVCQGKKMVSQVQVQWTGLRKEFATWEELNAIHRRYPQAPAWGHAASLGGGIVTAFPKTEACRQKK